MSAYHSILTWRLRKCKLPYILGTVQWPYREHWPARQAGPWERGLDNHIANTVQSTGLTTRKRSARTEMFCRTARLHSPTLLLRVYNPYSNVAATP